MPAVYPFIRRTAFHSMTHPTPRSSQGVIRKHVENHREFASTAAGGAPSAYEAGMKRFREYQDFWEKNHQPKAQNGSSPALSPALMEVWCGVQSGLGLVIGDRIG